MYIFEIFVMRTTIAAENYYLLDYLTMTTFFLLLQFNRKVMDF